MTPKVFSFSLALAMSLGMSARADIITDWNTLILNAIRTNRTSPPAASRQMAILHTAMYDAVNGINPTRYQSYRVRGKLPAVLSEEAAAAAAAHRVMVSLYPINAATYDGALHATLSQIRNRLSSRLGAAWGRHVANDILMWRADDGSDTSIGYTPGTRPGDWVPTPPAGAPPLLPQWPLVTPFGIPQGSLFRPPAPPALNTAQLQLLAPGDGHPQRASRRERRNRKRAELDAPAGHTAISGIHLRPQHLQRRGFARAGNLFRHG